MLGSSFLGPIKAHEGLWALLGPFRSNFGAHWEPSPEVLPRFIAQCGLHLGKGGG